MPGEDSQQLRAWVDYFRDLGIHDFYRLGEPSALVEDEVVEVMALSEPVAAINRYAAFAACH